MISQESFKRRLKVFGYDVNDPNSSIKNFPKVRISDEIQSEAYKWCQENFGERWVWSSPIHTWYTDLYFMEPEDALLCRLRFLCHPATA